MKKHKTKPKNKDLTKIILWNNNGYVNAYTIKKNILMYSSPIADKFCQEWLGLILKTHEKITKKLILNQF
jgi:hypothetical protein